MDEWEVPFIDCNGEQCLLLAVYGNLNCFGATGSSAVEAEEERDAEIRGRQRRGGTGDTMKRFFREHKQEIIHSAMIIGLLAAFIAILVIYKSFV